MRSLGDLYERYAALNLELQRGRITTGAFDDALVELEREAGAANLPFIPSRPAAPLLKTLAQLDAEDSDAFDDTVDEDSDLFPDPP